MKIWMAWLWVVGAVGLLGARAETPPVEGGGAGASALTATNLTEKINREIQSLLKEETELRVESRSLSFQWQNFAAELDTNNVALVKLHAQWREAQAKADTLRSELQVQFEKSPQAQALKARRDVADARLLEIRTRLRELMKDRGINEGRRRGTGRADAPPAARAKSDEALPAVKAP